MQDDDRIRKVLAGDVETYLGLVRDYEPMVRAYLAAHLRCQDEINEITQQTFIAAYRKLSSYRGDGSFGYWLKAICRNSMRIYFRTESRRRNAMSRYCEEVVDEVHNDLAACAHDRPVIMSRLRDCIDKLPDRMGLAVRTRYLAQEAMEQVAGRLGIQVNALSALLFRARKNLKICLERAEG